MPEKKTILLIEPFATLREAYTYYFTLNGYSIIEHNTGEDLETFCGENNFDIVIVNIDYIALPGLDLLRKVKTLVPKVKAIATAFDYFKTHLDTLKEIGVEGYLPNVKESKILLEAVNEVAAGGKYYIERKGGSNDW